MLSIGRETQSEASPMPAETNGYPRLHAADEAFLSPSIVRFAGKSKPAFEIKFLITETVARQVEAWAGDHLLRDAFADPSRDGSYQTTTLYLDTPGLDVFRREPGFRRRKFRLRRYGDEDHLFVERTSRRKNRLRKRRERLPFADLALLAGGGSAADWPGEWFRERIAAKALMPACRLTYLRTAFVKAESHGPLRVTLDRQMRAERAAEWNLSPVSDGVAILPEHVVCEFKYRGPLPTLFKEAIAALQLEAGGVSKYRQVMKAVAGPGLATEACEG
jgi:hypothetical protein